jgi:hypothetical protein
MGADLFRIDRPSGTASDNTDTPLLKSNGVFAKR